MTSAAQFSERRKIWRRIIRNPLHLFTLSMVALLVLMALFADLLAPYGMNELHMAHTLEPPSAAFLLGTDNLGRDMLSRVIYGARISMIVGLGGAAVSVFIGTAVGMVSGYIGRTFDLVLQRFVDTVMSLPLLPIVLTIADLAESWTVEPNRLTFNIRPGVMWQAMGKEHVMESRELTDRNLRRVGPSSPSSSDSATSGWVSRRKVESWARSRQNSRS